MKNNNTNTFDFDALFDEAYNDSKILDIETIIKRDKNFNGSDSEIMEDKKEVVKLDEETKDEEFDFDEIFNEDNIDNTKSEKKDDEIIPIVNNVVENSETIEFKPKVEDIETKKIEIVEDEEFDFDEDEIREDIKHFEEKKNTINKKEDKIVEISNKIENVEKNKTVKEKEVKNKIELKKETKVVEPIINTIKENKETTNKGTFLRNNILVGIIMLIVGLVAGYFLANQNNIANHEIVEKIVEKKVVETIETKSYYIYFRLEDVLSISNETSKLNNIRYDHLKNNIFPKIDTKYDTETVLITMLNGKNVNFKTTYGDLRVGLLKIKEETITLNDKSKDITTNNQNEINTGKVGNTKDIINNIK